MVNEIANVGPFSGPPVLQGRDRAAQVTPMGANAPVEASRAGATDALIPPRQAVFAAMVASKDEALRVAQSVRQTVRALEEVQATVRAMQAAVQAVVKQYPPFPPGSEQRLQYLNSISALRQQLEAMTIPPPANRIEPVFYPRASDLPALDPNTAADADVGALGAALIGFEADIGAGLSGLRQQTGALANRLDPALPAPPAAEAQAVSLSRTLATQLPGQGALLVTGGDALARIGA